MFLYDWQVPTCKIPTDCGNYLYDLWPFNDMFFQVNNNIAYVIINLNTILILIILDNINIVYTS